MKKIKRIYIIGTSGSGKSFLSKKLSEKLNIPCYDLDDIFWYKKYTKKRNVSARKKLLAKISRKDKWIIEGVFGSWIETAMKKADLVIILDIHIARMAWRILKRYFKRSGAHEESFKDALYLVKYAHSYKKGGHSSSYNIHISLVKKHKLKYIILKNTKQINRFIEKI